MRIPYLQKIRRSLSLKLGFAVALVVLATVGTMSVYAYVQERRSAVRRESAALQALSKDLASRIDLSLASGKILAAHLACTRELVDFLGQSRPSGKSQEACQAWLDLQLRQTSGMSSIFILSPTGQCLVSTNRKFIGHNYAFRPYFQEAAAGRLALSDWSVGLIDRIPHIDSSAPVWIQGKVAGVLVTEFPVAEIEQAVRSAGVNGRTAVLINRFSIALSHSDPAFQYHALKPLDAPVLEELARTRQFMGRDIPLDPQSRDLADAFERVQATSRQQTLTYRLGDSWKLAALTPLVQKDWVISVAIPQDEIFLPMRKAMERTLLVGLATALVGILAAFTLGRTLLGSIQRLSDAMGRFGAGDTAARAPVLGQDELGQLSQAFNTMADSLQAHQEHLEDLVKERTLELDRSESHHRNLTQAVPVGIFQLDGEGNPVFENEQWFEITGLRAFQRGPSHFEEHVHADDRETARSGFSRVFQTRQATETEFRFVRPDGQITWVIARLVPEMDDHGQLKGILGTLTNITEHKQAEERQRRLEAQLQESHKMESLGVLAAGVAHNINNVLAIIMGTASLGEQVAKEPQDREAYQTITQACLRGRDVVRSMLHFAQPSLLIQAPFELHALIMEVRILLENSTRNAIKVSEAFAGEPLWINGDPGSINHALLNLCLNALGAMPGGGTLTLRTAILEGDLVEVSVEDTGCGMTPEVLAHVLEPFYTTKDVGKGTGLGLSMTYGVVRAHGGTIDITSQPGMGTTVKLRFPRIPGPGQAEAAGSPAPALGSMNVFFVDDDEDVRFLMTRMLIKAGVSRLKAFAGGKEMLESLSPMDLPDLVILDQNMPGMDGAQTLARLRHRYPEMPVLISSGQPDIEQWECFQLPRVGVISKPFNLEEIQAKLAQFAL